jgi:hypothetical protein
MAVKPFIPQSPDPYLRDDASMSLAKFGHINSLVGDINTKLTGVATDTNMYIYLPTQTNPDTYPLHQDYSLIIGGVYAPGSGPIDTGYGNTAVGIYSSLVGEGNSYFNTVYGCGANVSVAQPSNVVIGYYATSAGADSVSIGKSASTNYNCVAIGHSASAAFSTSIAIGRSAVAAVANAVAIGNANSLFQIGGNFTPLARMHVKGLGNTNATTSLLVQNAAGTDVIRVWDDTNVAIGNIANEGFKLSVNGSLKTAGNVRMKSLPTSAAGLSTGDVWNDAGTLKIVL